MAAEIWQSPLLGENKTTDAQAGLCHSNPLPPLELSSVWVPGRAGQYWQRLVSGAGISQTRNPIVHHNSPQGGVLRLRRCPPLQGMNIGHFPPGPQRSQSSAKENKNLCFSATYYKIKERHLSLLENCYYLKKSRFHYHKCLARGIIHQIP